MELWFTSPVAKIPSTVPRMSPSMTSLFPWPSRQWSRGEAVKG